MPRVRNVGRSRRVDGSPCPGRSASGRHQHVDEHATSSSRRNHQLGRAVQPPIGGSAGSIAPTDHHQAESTRQAHRFTGQRIPPSNSFTAGPPGVPSGPAMDPAQPARSRPNRPFWGLMAPPPDEAPEGGEPCIPAGVGGRATARWRGDRADPGGRRRLHALTVGSARRAIAMLGPVT
jgi:hypothetical protein